VNAGWPFTTTWLPLAVTSGQMDRQLPEHMLLAALAPTSSYTVLPDGSTSTVPMDVDMVFRELAEPLAAGALEADVLDGALDAPPAAGFTEDELLPHPATSATRAVAPAAPRLNFPIPNADICYLKSRWRPPNECLLCKST
jgi:hypothetical protein